VASYNLSVGYSRANSTLRNNDFSRFNMRLNTDIEVIKNLMVRFDASYSDVDRKLRDDGAPTDLLTGVVTSPTFRHMEDGRDIEDPQTPEIAAIGTITLTNGGYEDE
jgi:hypothetical protein